MLESLRRKLLMACLRSPFFRMKCVMISIDVDINNSLALKHPWQRNKKRTNVISTLNPNRWGDMMKNHTKLNAIWIRVERKWKVVEPLFYACRYQASELLNKSANAIWFSFISSWFFIFWFPFGGRKTSISIFYEIT